MPKLTVLFSGKKSSGKTSAGRFSMCQYMNKKEKSKRFVLNNSIDDLCIIDTYNNKKIYPDISNDDTKKICDQYGVKMYSFADPLKDICINIFGLSVMQCYGTDGDKNSITNITWDNIWSEISSEYKMIDKNGESVSPSGFVTARQLMEVLGTHIFRKIDMNCWARGLYNKIKQENYDFAIICDGRFPNEISIGTELGVYAFRLLRNIYNIKTVPECALDDFPFGEYFKVINNSNMSAAECHSIVNKDLEMLFKQHGI